ncbi:SMI1/KNR4 family protein SUKH-1 [Nonomuraea polychroma]|uniref:SMI1/KNR4 family protein SUKH-1 n=2 Tax=Nonomuraea polychroma TaxID=46176 RepID=A0A438M8V1_9ACTN|nr:SMI1/KNR4 family protein SUKH-1 [Nonomuraea polychroma]
MDRTAWRPFLERWSEEWLAVREEEPLPFEEPITGNWLGYAPASDAQVAEAEARLGRTLPPSFREFLLTTDGWRRAGVFGGHLVPAEDLGWLRDLEPMWCQAYEEPDEWEDDEDEDADPDDEDDDEEAGLLGRALMISRDADAGVLFLDPDDVDEHGEWAAYELFSWSGMGPQRHGSFYELMYDLYAGFHALDRPQCQTQREWDEKVEQARLASLAGEVDGPLAVLAEAARFGRSRAMFLLFQMRILLGDHEAGQAIQSALRHGKTQPTWRPDEDLLTAEVLPALLPEHELAARHCSLSTLDALAQFGSDTVRPLTSGFPERAAEPGFRVRFGNAEFDAAVRAAVAAPGADPWPLLREALTVWRPMNEDHIAPIALLADPEVAALITPERGREILATRRG